MKKGQGLPLKTIVVGALILLVLVMVSSFFIPGVGRIFKKMVGITKQPGQKISTFKSNCKSWCNNLKATYNNYSATGIQYSAYCKEKRNFTSITNNNPGSYNYCYPGDTPSVVDVRCTINGKQVSC